ncbi:MAG: hypothetical protein HFI81_09445 [Eubacterium sp.]|jgi:hypothetical protein|nr:hypothetical protein [Eubacterium sp.]
MGVVCIHDTLNANHTAVYAKTENKENKKRDSVVEEFKRKHPKEASHVDKQVRAGRAVRLKNNAQNVSTQNMTLAEYKKYFYSLLDTIPYDPTRVNDTTVLDITEEGFEQMKCDPDYEAWVLGYFVEDRAVHNPFFGLNGQSGMFIREHFGASIEEHHGEGYSKSKMSGKTEKNDEESWWTKRRKRQKALMKQNEIKARKEACAKSEAIQREYVRQLYESRQRLHSFLVSDSQEMPLLRKKENPSSAAAAVTYDSLMDLMNVKLSGL